MNHIIFLENSGVAQGGQWGGETVPTSVKTASKYWKNILQGKKYRCHGEAAQALKVS